MKHNSCIQRPKGIVKTFGNKFYYFTKFIYLSRAREESRKCLCSMRTDFVSVEWSVSGYWWTLIYFTLLLFRSKNDWWSMQKVILRSNELSFSIPLLNSTQIKSADFQCMYSKDVRLNDVFNVCIHLNTFLLTPMQNSSPLFLYVSKACLKRWKTRGILMLNDTVWKWHKSGYNVSYHVIVQFWIWNSITFPTCSSYRSQSIENIVTTNGQL